MHEILYELLYLWTHVLIKTSLISNILFISNHEKQIAEEFIFCNETHKSFSSSSFTSVMPILVSWIMRPTSFMMSPSKMTQAPSKIRKLNKKYNVFMKGSTGKDLEASIFTRFAEIDTIKSDIEFMSGKLNIACDMLLTAYQKMSIVKYDAFKEMGGKLSFSLAMLDDKNNGYILTSVHTREGCYTYVKEIIKGESFVVLSEEERRALEEAKNKRNYMA